MAPVPRPQAPSVPAQPPRSDGLRALVDLASEDAAGPPEQFLLPSSPREAAALARREPPTDARAVANSASFLLAAVAVVVWAYLSFFFVNAAGAAAAVLPAVLVTVAWAAAHRLIRAHLTRSGAAGDRGHCVALHREDSKRIARRAAVASTELLRRSGSEPDTAFDRYHRTLVSLARYELAAGRALAAERDRTRLALGDPLRSLAGQIAQDRAADARRHRAAARTETERLEAALRS